MRSCKTLFAALAAAVLLVTAAPAFAQLDGPYISFSPYAGAAIWYSQIDLKEDILFGGRVDLMVNPYFGLEGTVDVNPTQSASTPDLTNRVTHLSAGAIVNLAPHSQVNPYIVGGWSQLHFDPSIGSEQTNNAWEAGAGFNILLAQAEGRRVDLRIDARNVFVKLDEPFPNANETQNNLFTSVGLQFSMGTSPKDSDLDGVNDRVDECANTPRLALVDARGCPVDSDQDGVPDGIDRCPATAVGTLVDDAGCGVDSDGDGVSDGIDQCANTPSGASVNSLGCPEDGDDDGVFDGIDECPGTPAAVVVDARGCAVDSDADGVFDGLDKCPATPSGVPVDKDGCPVVTSQKEVELLDTGLLRLDNVYFESSKWNLKPESSGPLDEVGAILSKWPQLQIEIAGHTDSQGEADFNQMLSERRAQAVLDYLITRYPNIKLSQFTARGYGESQSIATNDTPDGRRRNRRVEFRVLNREVLKR